MWRAEIKASLVITGGGDEESMAEIINELIALELEINQRARNHFRVAERPIDLRISFELTDTNDCIRVFHAPKFKHKETHLVANGSLAEMPKIGE